MPSSLNSVQNRQDAEQRMDPDNYLIMKRPAFIRRTFPAILLPVLVIILTILWKRVERQMNFNTPTSSILSVIIPCYNCERWLNETLQSLKEQTFKEFSVIFIDDGSTKPIGKSKLNQMYDGDIRMLRHWKNMGLSAARNTGAMAARWSKYILFLDPDDIIEPTTIEKLLLKMALESNRRCAFIYPAVTNFKVDESTGQVQIIGIDKSTYSSDALWRTNFITSFALIDRHIYMAAGGMCERIIKWWEDYDFWLRLANLGFHGELLDEPLFWYRRHSVGRSSYISRNIEESRWRLELLVNNPRDLPDVEDELADYDEDFTPPCYYSLSDSKISLFDRLTKWTFYVPKMFGQKRISALRGLRHLSSKDSVLPLLKRYHGNGRPSILFVIPWCQIGGADSYDLDILEVVKDHFSITIVTEIPVDIHQNLNAFKKYTQDIFHLPTLIDENDINAYSHQNSLLEYLVETKNVKHVYSRNSFAGYRFFKYASESGLKLNLGLTFHDVQHVYTAVDDGGWEHTTIPYHSFIDHRIVISSDLLRRQLELLGNWAGHSFKLIPPSIDLEFWGGAGCANPASTTVLFIGRIEDQKDPLKWIRVASAVAQLFQDTQFQVVGDGPLLDQMKADSAHLGNRIQFTNRFLNASEIRSILHGYGPNEIQLCNRPLLLMTSKYEGLPITMMEAVAAGVQVVSTPVGAVKEIADRSAGLIRLAHSTDEGALVKALTKILQSPLTKLPDSCFKLFSDSYSRKNFNFAISNVFTK